jgi:hypothetical protein
MVSAPAVVPLPLHGHVHASGEAILWLGDLGLELMALDYSLNPRHPNTNQRAISPGPLPSEPPPFLLQVVLEPGKAGCAFDPTKPTVTTPDGRAIHSYAYLGPGKLKVGNDWNAFERGCFAGGHANHPELLLRATQARVYPIGEKTCFVLGFDLRVQAGLTLTLDGLDSQGAHLQMPSLLFVRRDAASTLVATRPAMLEEVWAP